MVVDLEFFDNLDFNFQDITVEKVNKKKADRNFLLQELRAGRYKHNLATDTVTFFNWGNIKFNDLQKLLNDPLLKLESKFNQIENKLVVDLKKVVAEVSAEVNKKVSEAKFDLEMRYLELLGKSCGDFAKQMSMSNQIFKVLKAKANGSNCSKWLKN